jgi:hypothetical protein
MGENVDRAGRLRTDLGHTLERAAEAFERSAELADEHAARLGDDPHGAPAVERGRAKRARAAAQRARDNARALLHRNE